MVQDLHTHTVFSDGIDNVARMSQYAHQHHIQIGISDHILCKKMCDKSSVINYFKILDEYPVLKGAEIDLGETGVLDDYLIDNSDYIIGSIHNIRMNGENIKFGKYFDSRAGEQILNSDYIYNDNICCKALEKILLVISRELTTNPIDILGHCTVNPFYEQVNSKYYPSAKASSALPLRYREGQIHHRLFSSTRLCCSPDDRLRKPFRQ